MKSKVCGHEYRNDEVWPERELCPSCYSVGKEVAAIKHERDARLIAELLETCEALTTAMEEWSEDLDLSDTNEQARLALLAESRAAIAKARGDA